MTTQSELDELRNAILTARYEFIKWGPQVFTNKFSEFMENME